MKIKSAKKEMSSHCQLRLFMSKYLFEHKIQQLRQTDQVPKTCDLTEIE